MREWALRNWESNPFHIKSEREMEQDLLRDLKARGVRPAKVLSEEEDKVQPLLPGGPWDFPSALKTRRERYISAVVGSVILTAPMILMVLLRSTLASLVTVSVCTIGFAVSLAYYSPTKLPIELMSATAAYAAVLVVFIGGTAGQ